VAAAGSPASRDSDTAAASVSGTAAAPGGSKEAGDGRPFDPHLWLWITTLCVALACGFWLGYAALARRIRNKFGGLRVY
jgi:hypothetical protein